jgi:enamine deaminase RidA (YjgF/YER057c/UK114 family)
MFITDANYAEAVGRAHGEIFANIRPAATMVVVAALLDPRWHVEIEAEAIMSDER